MTSQTLRFRLRGRRHGLHADEDGQISALGVMAAAAFACLVLLVMNTGYATNGKIELQNDADVTAISGATWVARGLNIISLDNVTETQLMAIMLIVPALDKAIDAGLKVLEYVELPACSLLLIGAGICAAIIEGQIIYLQALQVPVEIADDAGLGDKDGPLWLAMKGLHVISNAVRLSFFGIGEAEAARIAGQNGAEIGVVIPAGYRLVLPVHEGRVSPDLCDPTRTGSHSRTNRGYANLPEYGYPMNVGPLEYYADKIKPVFYPVFNSGVIQFFDAFRDAQYLSMCGGSIPPRPTQIQVKTLPQCRFLGGGTAVWSVIRYETILFAEPQPLLSINSDNDPRIAPGFPRADDPATITTSCDWPPGYVGGRYRETRMVQESVTDANGNKTTQYRYIIKEYSLLSASVDGPPASTPEPDVPAGSSSPDDPNPYLLGVSSSDKQAQFEQQLRYLAVAYRRQPQVVAPAFFASPLGTRRLAYAQARVYNPTAWDTFTQDWRVSLEPASMIEDGSLVSLGDAGIVSKIAGRPGFGEFNKAVGLFGEMTSDVMAFFNNH